MRTIAFVGGSPSLGACSSGKGSGSSEGPSGRRCLTSSGPSCGRLPAGSSYSGSGSGSDGTCSSGAGRSSSGGDGRAPGDRPAVGGSLRRLRVDGDPCPATSWSAAARVAREDARGARVTGFLPCDGDLRLRRVPCHRDGVPRLAGGGIRRARQRRLGWTVPLGDRVGSIRLHHARRSVVARPEGRPSRASPPPRGVIPYRIPSGGSHADDLGSIQVGRQLPAGHEA